MFFDDGFIERHHNKRRSEFERLACEPCMDTPEVGGRVLVSAGVCGMGFEWERHEAEVLEVADTAYRVRFTHYKRVCSDELLEMWVHRFAVTDVLKAVNESEPQQ